MKIDRRTFTKSLATAAGMPTLPSWSTQAEAAPGPTYLRPDGSPTHW